nr:GDSL esterase/lipase At4g28780-like [Ipomoea batatas]
MVAAAFWDGAAAARAFFVFGDSLVDNGNNNYLFTSARADSPPYGIDYPTHRPTGRFSNGYNIPDLISQAFGSESTLAYLDPELRGQRLLVGANFASAGIGILNDTGIQFANIIRIAQQLQLFEQYQQRVGSLIGSAPAAMLVNQALFLITLGGNDFVNNYFLVPVSARRIQFSIPNFSRYLISEYSKILMRLYEMGARRVLVTGTGPLGCVPAELAQRSLNGQCAVEPQQAAAIFNPLLIQMIADLNQQLGSDIFVGVNAMQMQNDFINNPQAYGSMLWTRALQRDWTVHSGIKSVRKQGRVPMERKLLVQALNLFLNVVNGCLALKPKLAIHEGLGWLVFTSFIAKDTLYSLGC